MGSRGKALLINVGNTQKVSGLTHPLPPRKQHPVPSWGEGQGWSQPFAALKNPLSVPRIKSWSLDCTASNPVYILRYPRSLFYCVWMYSLPLTLSEENPQAVKV
jgi:hypothetical protein